MEERHSQETQMKKEINSWVEEVKEIAKQEERDAVIAFLRDLDPILAQAICQKEHHKP